MVMNNLKRFKKVLTGSRPIYQIEALLVPPDVVLNPASNDVYKLTVQCVRDAVET